MTVSQPPTTARTPDELGAYLRERLEDDVLEVYDAYGTATVTVAPHALPRAARLCKSDPGLRFEFFDFMSGVDLGDEGFAVVTHLYSLTHRHHIALRAVAEGGREKPTLPTISGIYRGANWHEREQYDMFGIVFEGHPGLLPRILTVENFEGWPLRKDFLLSTRVAKPWPGAKEPEERKEAPAGQSEAVVANAEPVSAEGKAAAASAKAQAADASPAAAPAEPAQDFDQALYDQLIAEGKSERVARAKAKAAFVRREKARIRAQREGT
jgi:NADH:ubiquinone oxidoreductase subunit C